MTDPRLRFLAGNAQDEDEALRLLDNTTIQVVAAQPLVEARHQMVLFMLVDLLGRVFPRLDITIDTATPAADVLPPGGPTVGDRLTEVRRHSPLASLEPGPADIVVLIGPGAASADIVVDASEWQSYLGNEPSRLSAARRECAIGPFMAACRASAAVHNLVLAPFRPHTLMAAEIYFSALTYRQSTNPIDDPAPPPVGPLDALLVGGGSIGGAATFAMSYEPGLSGLLRVCDPQKLDDTNPYRSVLATAEAASAEAAKADEVRKALSHHKELKVEADEATVTEWEAKANQPRALPLVLVAVDSLASREAIQDALPLDVVNAAVSGDELAVSGHRTGVGPCMCCLHMPNVLDATAIKNRVIADATGITARQVNELRDSAWV